MNASVLNDNNRYARRILQVTPKFCFVADGSLMGVFVRPRFQMIRVPIQRRA